MTALAAWLLVSLLQAAPLPVRFHHVHYRVGDPSAAMNHVARAVEGTREIVPGLGVGVRLASELLLFDRLDEGEVTAAAQPALADAYTAAVAWFGRHGMAVTPANPGGLRMVRVLPGERYDHLAFSVDDLARARAQIERSGAAPLRSTEDAVLFDAGGGVRIEIVRAPGGPDAFWCPMHPDVRSASAGSCHLCGMPLVPIPPPKLGEYNLDVRQRRTRGAPGLTGLELSVRDPETNAAVTSFVRMHERLLHLFIVGRDLDYFQHLHPELAPGGGFVLTHAIPPGEYMLIADFLPKGGTTQMVQRALIVGGTADSAQAAVPEAHGVKVTMVQEDFLAGKYACLTFTVTDARTGAPITDLEPFLGAPAHMLLVRGDLTDAVHAHPEEIATGGPTISFHPLVPAVGDYKLWVQIQRAGKVITVPFSLRAER